MKELKTASIDQTLPWQDYPAGLEISEPSTSVLNKTGAWRTRIPCWDQSKCKQCLMCTAYCPDSSIPVINGKRGDFSFDYCKGCGICADICPFSAISLEEV